MNKASCIIIIIIIVVVVDDDDVVLLLIIIVHNIIIIITNHIITICDGCFFLFEFVYVLLNLFTLIWLALCVSLILAS